MKRRRKLSKNFLLILLCCLTGALGTQPILAQVDGQVSVDFPAEDKLMEIARETVKAYEMGNWEALRRNATKDATFYNLGSYDSLNLDQTIKYWTEGRKIATPLLSEDGVWLAVAVPQGPREGNWILHWGTNTLSYPTGETITFPYHVAMKFRDESVSQIHFYYDNNRIIRALGYEIQPPLEDLQEGMDVDQDDKNN